MWTTESRCPTRKEINKKATGFGPGLLGKSNPSQELSVVRPVLEAETGVGDRFEWRRREYTFSSHDLVLGTCFFPPSREHGMSSSLECVSDPKPESVAETRDRLALDAAAQGKKTS